MNNAMSFKLIQIYKFVLVYGWDVKIMKMTNNTYTVIIQDGTEGFCKMLRLGPDQP